MRKINLLQVVIAITLLITPGLLRAQADYKECRDHPLLSRMKDFYIPQAAKKLNTTLILFTMQKARGKP